MLKTSCPRLAPSGAAESSPAGTAGSATLKRTVPAGTADEEPLQPSLAGLCDLLQPTRQSLPGYFHSRLSALGVRRVKVVILAFLEKRTLLLQHFNNAVEPTLISEQVASL